jgi:hypothetical protein
MSLYCLRALFESRNVVFYSRDQVPHGLGAPRTLNYYLGVAAVGPARSSKMHTR